MTQYRSSNETSIVWRAVEVFAVTSFLVTLLVMFVQVASRYALGISVPWTDETSRFFFIAAVFSGAVLCQRRGSQIRITVLLDILPVRIRRWFEMTSDVLTAVIAVIVIIGTVEMARNTANLKAATLPVTYAWLYVVQGLSLCLILFLVLRDIWIKFKEGASRT